MIDTGLPHVNLPIDSPHSVRNLCRNDIYGDKTEWFRHMRIWAECMRRSDADVRVVVECDGTAYKRAFICPGFAARLAGRLVLRPVFCVDAAFCKRPVSTGHLLFATAWDANDSLAVLAFAHVYGETLDNWGWFVTNCMEVIPGFFGVPTLVALSDGNAGECISQP